MFNNLKKNKQIVAEIGFLFLISLIPFLWFKPGQIIIGLDSGYAINYIQYFNQRIYTWLSSHNFGVDMSIEIGAVIFSALPAFINLIGVPALDVQKVLFVSWFFVLLLSMYVFSRYIFPKKDEWPARIISVIFYTINLHIYSFWLQGEQAILASYVLLPLILLLLLRFVDGKSTPLRSAILLNIVFLAFGAGGIRGISLIGSTIAGAVVLVIYFFLIVKGKDRWKYILKFVRLAFWFTIFFILSNAYYLIPFISSFSLQYGTQIDIVGGVDGAVEWAKSISLHTSFINLFRLNGDNNWYDKPFLWSYPYLTNGILIFVQFLFPILAFLAALLKSDKKEKSITLFFILFALVGLFLSAGIRFPLGFVYEFMMRHMPGFATFRSPYYKFMPVVYFAFSILIAKTLLFLLRKFFSKDYVLVSFVFIVLLLGYNYPFFSNSNFQFDRPFSSMVSVPQYVKDIDENANINSNYRTLVLPPPGYYADIKAYSWGYWAAYPVYSLVNNQTFLVNDAFGYSGDEDNAINSIYEALRTGNLSLFKRLSEISNVKYILISRDIEYNYDKSLSESPEKYADIINKNTNLFRKKWTEGPWSVYEISNSSPTHIKAINSIISISPNTKSQAVYDTDFSYFMGDKEALKFPLKTEGSFSSIDCSSCQLFNGGISPDVSSPRILPTSIFYKLKLWQENRNFKKLSSNDEKVNYLLGLSLKRTTEILRVDFKTKSKAQWIDAMNLLSKNIADVRSVYLPEYKKTQNITVLKRIYDYVNLNLLLLDSGLKLEKVDAKNQLGKVLLKVVDEMKQVRDMTAEDLNKNYWINNFKYDISSTKGEIYLNENSLPRDVNNNILRPESFQIDDDKYAYSGIDLSKLKSMKNVKTLTLNFDLPNLLGQTQRIELNNKDKINNCIVSPIQNYSGTKKYLITANPIENSKSALYIVRKYTPLQVESSPKRKKNQFSPDLVYKFPSAIFNKVDVVFSGRPNDFGADLYICSENNKDPESIFEDVNVAEIINPEVYSFEKRTASEYSLPNISFTQTNPTEYKINVKGAKDPYVLFFSERFSPLWDVYIDGKKNQYHTLINNFGNGWYIDKKGDYNIVLIFKNQSEYNIGLVTTFLSLIGMVIILISKHEKEKK